MEELNYAYDTQLLIEGKTWMKMSSMMPSWRISKEIVCWSLGMMN